MGERRKREGREPGHKQQLQEKFDLLEKIEAPELNTTKRLFFEEKQISFRYNHKHKDTSIKYKLKSQDYIILITR